MTSQPTKRQRIKEWESVGKRKNHKYKRHCQYVCVNTTLRKISNKRQWDSVSSGYPNTEKRVENTTRSRVFFTKFEGKHCLECLIYLLSRKKSLRVNGEVKSSKSVLIKTGYPNLPHACDFLCFRVMNYERVWERIYSEWKEDREWKIPLWPDVGCNNELQKHCLFIFSAVKRKIIGSSESRQEKNDHHVIFSVSLISHHLAEQKSYMLRSFQLIFNQLSHPDNAI